MSEVSNLHAVAQTGRLRPVEAVTPISAGGGQPGRQPVAAGGKAEQPPGTADGDAEWLGRSVTRINEHVQSISRELHFSIDPETGYQVVKVLDTQSGEVIRQMPSDQVLALAETLTTEGDLPRQGMLMLGIV